MQEGSSEPPGRDDIAGDLREQLIPRHFERQLKRKVRARISKVLGPRQESEGAPEPEPEKYDGRYVLLDRVGSGGMGTVYAAYDTELDRKVAIKILRGEKKLRDRLRREPQALAQLSHPNVVQVYDVREHDDSVYLSMEFIAGSTLKKWVEQEEPSWREVLDKYIQAGRGLAAAHAAKIIHRDFKPENALVGEDGRVRVLDFGLARARETVSEAAAQTERADPASSGALLRPITQTGAVMGTPVYMSPEQHLGGDVDERTDQFAFCVALYQALYQARPFLGETTEQLKSSVTAGELQQPPSESKVPAWVRKVVLRGLSIERDERHPSMAELLDALGRDPAVYVRRAVFIVGAAALLVVAGSIWQSREELSAAKLAQLRSEKDEETAQKLAEQRQKERVELEARRRRDALALAEVAREMDRDPTEAIARLKNLSAEFEDWGTDARLLASDALHRGIASKVFTLPEGEVSHGLSPDGKTVVTRNPTTGTVQLLDIDAETRRSLGTGGTMPAVAFSPDGLRVAGLRLPDGLRMWEGPEVSGGKIGTAEDGHIAIAFDPTGAILVYGQHAELHRWRPSGQQILNGHQDRVTSVAVHPEGTMAATVDAAGLARLWDLRTLEARPLPGPGPVAFSPRGDLAIVTETGDIDLIDPQTDEAVRYEGRGGPVDVLVFSPGSTRMAAGMADGRLAWWDLSSSQRTDLPGVQDEVESLRFVSDEALGATSLLDLVLHEMDGSRPQVLRGHGGVGFWTVREDGQVVTVGNEGAIRLWAPRPGATRVLAGHEGDVGHVVAGPEQAWVTGGDEGVIQRWDADVRGAEVVAHSDGQPVVALAVAPIDGRIAWAADDGVVRIVPLSGISDPRELGTFEDGVTGLAWGPGGILAVVVGEERLEVRNPTTGGRIEKWSLDDLAIHSVGFVDDGRVLAIATADDERAFVTTFTPSRGQFERIELQDEGVLAAAYSREGRYVAFSRYDRSIAVWDTRSKIVRKLGQHEGLVNALAFTHDGRTLVSAGADGVVRLWDVEQGFGRAVPLTDRRLRAVAISHDGTRFVSLADEAMAFVGRDDLPRDPEEISAWIEGATDLIVETKIDWRAVR